jgi:trehalose 6-phosphate phosphatase
MSGTSLAHLRGDRGMATLMECGVLEGDAINENSLEGFFESVTASRDSTLLLDFDGTLAPFRIDPSRVRPWAGVPRLLEEIHALGRTHIGIVTGRPAKEVASQIGLPFLQIWGLHGAERLFPDGRVELDELLPHEHDALAAARKAIRVATLGPGVRVEEKWNAVVVHWRGKPPRTSETLLKRTLELLQPFADEAAMHLLQFDGGIEMRAGRNKGDAVKLLLNEMRDEAPVAYLGDDTTDEDAFRVLSGRGLTVLVRREWRPSAATLWLRPPSELRAFLAGWAKALQS